MKYLQVLNRENTVTANAVKLRWLVE